LFARQTGFNGNGLLCVEWDVKPRLLLLHDSHVQTAGL